MRKSQFSLILSTLALVFVSSSHVNAQPSMTGLITDVRAEVTVFGEKVQKKFAIDLYLQIRNSSNQPLILFRPDSFIGNTKVTFLSATNSTEDVCTINWVESRKAYYAQQHALRFSRASNSYEGYDFLGKALERLDLINAPTNTQFVVVEPESYFEFRTTVEVDTGFEVNSAMLERNIAKDRASHDDSVANEKPGWRFPFSKRYTSLRKKAKSPYLQIEFELSPGSYKKDPNLLRTLQSRWSKFGKMPLNGDNYYLKSDPIVISIPD